MSQVLIVKTGALGDVVRTTSILRRLTEARVVWLSSAEAIPLLPPEPFLEPVPIEKAGSLRGARFDIVLSLEEDLEAATAAASVRAQNFVGCRPDGSGRLLYTESAAPWFDMGLASRLGKPQADKLKLENRRSYQEFLFSMAGFTFRGEEAWIARPRDWPAPADALLVGIEARAGRRWPAKEWRGFGELERLMAAEGLRTERYVQRPDLTDHVRAVSRSSLVVSVDTLTLHLALALGKPTAAIFTCTSPNEIYGYGRLRKIVSPLLQHYFYTTRPTSVPGDAIPPSLVLREFLSLPPPVPERPII